MPLRFRRPSQCFALAAGSLLLSCKAADRSHETAAPPALQATARIADTGGGPAYEFTSIAQVLERNDSVFVRQQGIQEIRVFDTSGIHLGTIGRAGGGPGEFRSLEAMGFVGDTLWSIDGDLRRLSFFSPNGTLLVTLPYQPVSPALGDGVQFFFPYFKALLDDGSVLGFGGSAARDIASGKVAASPLLRMARSGATHDTLGWVPIGNAHMIMRSERRTMYRVQPYSDAPLTIYGPEARRVYIVHRPAAARADSEHVTVTALTATGDTAFVTRVGYLPEVLDRTKVDSLRAAYHKAHAGIFPPADVDRALYVPAFRPPITGGIAATDGALWLRWDDDTRSGLVTVIDPDGRTQHTLSIVPGAKLLWASTDAMWAEVRDENDVPTLVRYQITSRGS